MTFTKEDRNLLVRVGKHLRDAIESEEHGEGSTPLRDRLLRDERDLQALRRRLEAHLVEPDLAAARREPSDG